ncbi:putative WRKY transcription factor [Trifolium repens]|nr:putative WRKY transcription factor [Trifolium repens]
MENDWDLSSIVCSCKAISFTNSSTFGETSPQNLSTTNSIISPINTTPSCFEDFIFNQENCPIAYTHTMKNNWDLSSIVCHCKVTSFTNHSTFCETPPQNLTTINSIISPIITSPSCFEDFIFNQKSSMIANTHTMENDWNLSSIMRRCKVTTFTNPSTFCETPPQNLTTIKNKKHVTSVCHVKEDKLSEDKWQWKKYGRKPIKGSPHLRSYYKCSSFKDCPARKQVEKSETEENTYVVTY